jgi:bacterioferritin (cytochrome b1)
MVKGTQRQHSPQGISQGQVIDLLNQDLCRHLEAIMLSVNYFEMVDCNMDRNAAGQLATQMHKELLQWALTTAAQIRSIGGVPEIKAHVGADIR